MLDENAMLWRALNALLSSMQSFICFPCAAGADVALMYCECPCCLLIVRAGFPHNLVFRFDCHCSLQGQGGSEHDDADVLAGPEPQADLHDIGGHWLEQRRNST